MTDALQAISRSLSDDVRTLSSISQNVANLNTPGYRAVRSVPQFDRASGLSEVTSLRDGGLAQTAQPLDLALQGPGFFTVDRGGEMLLVRSGQFRTDAGGFLVTAGGDRVLGDAGAVSLPAGQVHVDADGSLRVGDQRVAQLQIVAVADPSRLRPVGAGAYRYDGTYEAATGHVVQGALERANVEPADQMLQLMDTMRHAESVQRAMSMYDKVLDVGINKIGEN